MIEVQGLTKHYGDKVAVDHLTFTVRPGIVTGFLGPNGAGKSTTMRMMLDLDNPTAGSVRIDGRHYRQLKDPLTYVGALLDAKAMHGGRSAANHLLCLAQSNGIPRSRVDMVLDTVGLTAVARKRSKGFSLGMGQRLGIAAALLGNPRILMFDEPVNGLDPEGIHWIRHLMKNLAAQGRTVFVSSHLMSEMALTADHLVVIGQGRLLADTSMPDFIQQNSRSYVRVRSPERQRLLDVLHREGIPAVAARDGSLEIDRVPARRLGELAAAHQLVLHELSPQQASLEEAFMQLTAGSVEYHAHDGEPAGPRAGQPRRPPVPQGAFSGGPQPGGPQPGGPQPGGPQWTGPQWGGPQPGGPQRGGPQRGGPRPGGPPPGGPQPGGPQSGGWGAEWQKRRS